MDWIQILTTIALSLLAVFFTLQKTKKETMWQKRLDAYTKILDALHVCHDQLCKDYDKEIERMSILNFDGTDAEEPEPTETQKSVRKERETVYQKNKRELQRIVATGRLILSSEVTECLQEVLKPLSREQCPTYFDHLDHSAAAFKKGLEDIIAIGRKDLR